ncbi:MAG: GGDEF domain-containing protein [Eubacteriales bacterium]
MNWKKGWHITVLLWILVSFTFSTASATEKKTVKVAFIENNSFYTMEINGGYSGYNYDYLMKVAQYTDWNYEFVVISETSTETGMEVAMKMLENGEIDLLGSMPRTAENEEKFQFGVKNYAVSRYVLSALGNNPTITENTYFLQENLSVAVVQDDMEAYNALQLIGLSRDTEIAITYVETEGDGVALLLDYEVDALMTTDVSDYGEVLVDLVSLTPSPLYFASTKGNQDLLAELDEAIAKLELSEFSYPQLLVDRYFGHLHTGKIILTEKEKEALADFPYLTVGLLKGREPYQFYNGDDEAVPQGISVEILEELSEIIGVEFRYVWLESREEMRDKIASQEIDICSTVPYDSDYELTYFFDVVISQPYLTTAVTWLHNQNETRESIPHFYYLADNIPFFPDEDLVEVFDFEKTLLELSQVGGISLFADPYMAQYQVEKLGIQNVEMQTITSIESKICFGIGKHLNETVVGLINHALLHVDPFVMDEILYHNLNVQGGQTVEAFLRENTSRILVIITLVVIVVAILLYFNGKKLQKLTRQDSLTKLYNAGYFHDYVGNKIKKLENGCLILMDIDYFKDVNDTYGHQVGDTVIKAVAEKLKKHFRTNDIVARLGGDEFIIFLEYPCEQEEFESKSKSILDGLRLVEGEVAVTLSIGAYTFHESMTYKDLYKKADEELYKVKERGRNGFSYGKSVKTEA